MKKRKNSKDKPKGMLLNDVEMASFLLSLASQAIEGRKKTADSLKELVKLNSLDEQDTVRHAIEFLSQDITPQEYLDEVDAKLDREEKK